MKTIKYLSILLGLSLLIGCNEPEDVLKDYNALPDEALELPTLTSGSADFSKYVALGASFTAGFTDSALFKASQESSFPNILANQFANAGGGVFTQPLMNDNLGGIAAGGVQLPGASVSPRLVFDGELPTPITNLIGPAVSSTDLFVNNPSGPFNNIGVPGAKSTHLLYDGYGNIGNLGVSANPYFVRMASSPTATMLGDAMAQNPTFFTLSEIGAGDVLGYAMSGGDGSDPITPSAGPPGVGFDATLDFIVNTLTSGGAKGVVTNVPYITDLPHFTTVPHNPLSPLNPDFAPQIPTLNALFGQLNQIFIGLGMPERAIVFSETEASPVVIKDEGLSNIALQIIGALNSSPTFPAFVQGFGLAPEDAPLVAFYLGITYAQTRQATENDLLVLPSLNLIGTVNTDQMAYLISQGLPAPLAGQFSAEGILLPLADKWVLTPEEQEEIKNASDAFNQTIENVVNANNNVALLDLNSMLAEASTTGLESGDYIVTTDFITGGLVSLDGIHLTSRGYSIMANEFLKVIDANFGSNFEASGNLSNPREYNTNYSHTLQ